MIAAVPAGQSPDAKGVRFALVFALTILLHVALPLLREYPGINLLIALCYIVVLWAAGLGVLSDPRARWVYRVSLLGSFVLTIGAQFNLSDGYRFWWVLYHALMFTISTGLVLRWVVVRERVTGNTIFAALAGYYLMGFAWALLYALIDIVMLGAYTVPLVEGHKFDNAFYFSFVTLTTLGYGDISPTHPLTHALATTEALVGQIFLAVLVARLVALHITHAERERRASAREDPSADA